MKRITVAEAVSASPELEECGVVLRAPPESEPGADGWKASAKYHVGRAYAALGYMALCIHRGHWENAAREQRIARQQAAVAFSRASKERKERERRAAWPLRPKPSVR